MAFPYDRPRTVQWQYNAVNFGTTTTRYLTTNPNANTFLHAVYATVTTTFVGTSTPASIQVGVSGTLGAYGTLTIGSVASEPTAPSALAAYSYATGITSRNPNSLPWVVIPGGTLVYVTMNAPTGGSPAGVADVMVDLNEFYSG